MDNLSEQVGEPRRPVTPIGTLSLAKQRALAACFKGAGMLYKKDGFWTFMHEGELRGRISGMTVANLSRDGMLTLIDNRRAAKLTSDGALLAAAALASNPEPISI